MLRHAEIWIYRAVHTDDAARSARTCQRVNAERGPEGPHDVHIHRAGGNAWFEYGFVVGLVTTLNPKFDARWHALHPSVRASKACPNRVWSCALTASSSCRSGSVMIFWIRSGMGSGASLCVG